MNVTTSYRWIEPSDIITMRCDAVVEFCYEYNGIRLLGPEGAWDISSVTGLEYHSATLRPSQQAAVMRRR